MTERFSTRWVGIILVIALLMTGVLGFVNLEPKSGPAAEAVANAGKQLDALLAVGHKVSQEPLDVIIKWQGTWNTDRKPEEAAALIAEYLGLGRPYHTMVQDHLVYRAEGLNAGARVQISVTRGSTQELYVVAQIKGLSESNSSRLKEAQTQAGEKLISLGMDVKWNAAVQGSGDKLTETLNTKENVTVMLEKLERHAGAFFELRRVEGFQDGRTVSESYEVPNFPISVQSGGNSIALQMAVHDNTVTGQKEFSLGSPVLTVEY